MMTMVVVVAAAAAMTTIRITTGATATTRITTMRIIRAGATIDVRGQVDEERSLRCFVYCSEMGQRVKRASVYGLRMKRFL